MMCEKTMSREDAIRYFPELVYLGISPTDITSDEEYKRIIDAAKSSGRLPQMLPKLK
jgi:hypothetical protein